MAGKQSRIHSLDIAEHRDWQERFWNIQRLGWVLMTLFIVAAALGATGKGGPLATASVRTADGTVHYPRVTRWRSDEDIVVRLPASASGEVELLVSPAFSEVFGVDSVSPDPRRSTVTPSGHAYTFAVTPGGPKEIFLHVTSGRPTFRQPLAMRVGESVARMEVTVLP